MEENKWIKIISKYNHPDNTKSWIQLISTMFLYAAGWALLIFSLAYPYWVTLLLALPVAGVLVRLFIIYHDCTHGSYFSSRLLREITGTIIGILTFTPYLTWGKNHIIHHKTAGNLDKRGIGDVWTLTVKEYLKSSGWEKFKYRAYRHPFVMFGLGSFIAFLIINRFTNREMDAEQKLGVYITNGGIISFAVAMSLLIGIKSYLLIQLPIMYIAGILGFWLFYIQHQFDPSYWSRSDTWNYQKVALEGSSFYKLPAVFRWFSGSIGYHHVHHLSPMIPNYNLKKCHDENEMFRSIKPVGFKRSLKALNYRLWDEEKGEMVSYKKIKK